jgi:hypothetical protein
VGMLCLKALLVRVSGPAVPQYLIAFCSEGNTKVYTG